MNTAAEIIEKYTVPEGTFTIDLGNDDKFVIRNITSVSDFNKVRKRAQELIALNKSGNVPPAWKPFMPISDEVAEIVAKLTMLVVEPKFNDVEALQLCDKAGLFASFLHSQMLVRYAHIVAKVEAEELDQSKNEFGATEETFSPASSGETTSTPDGSGSVVTPIDGTKTTGDTPATT